MEIRFIDLIIDHSGPLTGDIAGRWMTVPIGFSRLGSTTNRANRSRWNVPSPSIVSDPEAVGRWWHGVKIIGTDVPGLFAAGTFYYHGELVSGTCRIRSEPSLCRFDTSVTKS